MNKTELIEKVAANVKEGDFASKAAAERAVNAVFESIKDAVAAGDSVQLIGFGTFECVERAERTGRNPQTGESLVTPAHKAVKFKAGKAFKDVVNPVDTKKKSKKK